MDDRLLKAPCIVFDVGNVLLRFDPARVLQLIPPAHREAIGPVLFDPVWRWAAFDLGVESNEAIARSVAEAAGVAGGADMVLDAFLHFHTTLTSLPLYDLIPALGAVGKRLYALTNYGEPAFSSAMEAFPHLKRLDGLVVSAREKLAKPDPEIFQLLARRFRLNPKETLFIDDNADNIAAAEREGFQTWLYPDPAAEEGKSFL